ncbi:MAG: T9SS type A sorting domain-containing protein, partial [bacterium]
AIGYAISQDSLYVRMTNITGVTDGDKTEIGGYQLFVNFPNPFNPRTTINYAISQPGFVRLKIYNMSGREIRTLVSAWRAAGKYSVYFDASGLASGVYFCSLQVGNFKDMRKMLLLR